MFNNLNHEELASILAMGYFNVLEDKEGIIVHFNKHAYVIHKDDEQVKVNLDDELLSLKDRSWVWMHDEPVGNA